MRKQAFNAIDVHVTYITNQFFTLFTLMILFLNSLKKKNVVLDIIHFH